MGWFDWLFRRKPARDAESFKELALRTALDMPRVKSARPHPDEEFALEIEGGEGRSHTVYLHNVWGPVQEAGFTEQRDALRGFFHAMLTAPTAPATWEEARDRLLLGLRSPSMFLRMELQGHEVVLEPAFPDLVQALYVDSDAAISFVPITSLAEWGVTRDEALAQAAKNLLAKAPKLTEPLDPGAMTVFAPGAVENSSWLLANGWLKDAAGGRPIVAWADDRDWLKVMIPGEGVDLSSVVEMARKEWQEANRPVSPRLWTVDEIGAVVPFEVPEDDPAFRELEISRCVSSQVEYGEQKAALEPWHEEQGIDVFVASVMVFEKDGQVRSIATWPFGIDTVLPVADYITMGSDPSDMIEIPWARLVEHIPGFEPMPDLYPLRYRCEEWPSDEVLAKLDPVLPSKRG